MKKLLKISLIVLAILLLLGGSFYFAINRPAVQTWLTHRITGYLSDELGATVSIRTVEVKFFSSLVLQDMLVEDLAKDTLFYAKRLDVKLSLFQPLKGKLRIAKVELHDPQIYLHRAADSTHFNYQFIADRLTSTDPDTAKSNPLDLSFDIIDFRNLDFNMHDERTQKQFTVQFNNLLLDADKLDLRNRQLILDEMSLSNSAIAYRDYRPHHDTTIVTPEVTQEVVKQEIVAALNPECWDVQVRHLAITGSSFSYHRENYPLKETGMDFRNIEVTGIELDITGAKVDGDTLFAHVNNISAKERSGFTLDSLTADAKLAPNIMAFSKLRVLTPNSNIHGFYSMEYNSLGDFGDYEDKVIMTGRFNDSKVSIKDINYYAGVLTKIEHNTVMLTGYIRGPVSNLKGKDLNILYGKSSTFKGSMSFKGLPKIDETFVSAEIEKIVTNAADLTGVYPHLDYPENMSKLGVIQFTGNFDGFFSDFVANGEMISSIGKVKSDINFKLDDNKRALFNGNFSTVDFDLGQWLSESNLGRVTMQSKVTGAGLKLAGLEANGDGVIKSINIRGYEYKDVVFDGDFEQDQFKGKFTVKDPNLDVVFDGTINLKQNPPVFRFHSKVNKANLKALHITDEDYRVSTDMTLDIIGDKIDLINGIFSANGTRVYKGDSLYTLNQINFRSFDEADGKTLILKSDYADATMKGNFNFKDLPRALSRFFSYYFEPTKRQELAVLDTIRQEFDFDVTIRNTGNITRLFHDDLRNISGGTIKGFFNSQGNSFDLNTDIEGATYKNFRLSTIDIDANSNADKVSLHTSIDTVFVKDSLVTQWVKLDAGIVQDTMLFTFAVQDEKAPNRMVINGKVASDMKMLSLSILPSVIFINDEEWKIDEGNSVYYDGDLLMVSNLQLFRGSHYFNVNTFNPPGRNHLNIEFENINIEDVFPSLKAITGHEIKGNANGYMTILDVLKEPKITAMANLNNLTVNKDVLGDLQMTGTYIPTEEKINLAGNFKGALNQIGIKGSYDLKKKEDYLDIDFDLKHVHLPHIENFVKQYVSRIRGTASGNLHLGGTFENPEITGKVTARHVLATVNYLNTVYAFNEEEITFNEDEIDLGTIQLVDIKGNEAIGSGSIFHDHLRNFSLNIDVRTDKFQFLNTTVKNNSTFFGEVYAKGLVQITGPINDIEFYANATTMKETVFSIAVNSAKDVDKYSFYQFIEKDSTKKNKDTGFKIKTGGVSLNFDLEITPDAEMNLIMSATDGDVIQAWGRGTMKVVYDKTGDFTMVGRYEIEKGSYLFSLQKIISKNFEIAKGSEILWTGDPYDARLAITAVYKLRAAPYDLIEDVLKEDAPKQQSKNRVPVYLELKLAGSLLSPDINFDIDVPEADQGIRSALDSKLALIKLDQNELNKQVVGLLVLNRFLPVIPLGSSVNSNIAQGVNNTVSEFVSNQLSLYLTDWISKFITEVQLDINYRNYQNQSTGADNQIDFENRRELQLALTKSFFNDRVEIDVGGNFDFGENGQGTGTGGGGNNNNVTNNVTGDFEIRYNITADGRIRVKVFRKGEYDIFQDRNLNKTGVGISYRKEFDTMKDFFDERRERRKRKEEKKNHSVQPDPKKEEEIPVVPSAFK